MREPGRVEMWSRGCLRGGGEGRSLMVGGDVFGPVTLVDYGLTVASGSSIGQLAIIPVPCEKEEIMNACVPISDSANKCLGARGRRRCSRGRVRQ